MLGPFLIWAAHFALVYTIASVADLAGAAHADALRMAGLAISAVCAVALAAQFIRSRRSASLTPLAFSLAGVGFAASLIAVAWQSLPLIFSV